MRRALLQTSIKAQVVLRTIEDENGLDLVEFGLLMLVVSLATVSAIGALAGGIIHGVSSLFNHVSSTLNHSAVA